MIKFLFWPVLAPSFLFTAGLGAVITIQVLAALQVGMDAAQAALLVAAAGLVSLLCTVPVGAAIDRVGDKQAMTVATLSATASLALSLLALVSSGPWALPLFILGQLTRAPASVAFSLTRQAVVAATVAPEDRGKAMTALGGAQRAGMLVGPFLGSLLLFWFPLWSVFLLCIVLFLLATGLLYIQKLTRDFDAATQAATSPTPEGDPLPAVPWKVIILAGLGVSTLSLMRVSQSIVLALWGLHLGWSEAHISLAVAIGSALEMIFMFPGGYLKDRVGRSFILCLTLALFGTGYLLIATTETSLGFISGLAIVSLGNGLGAGINMTIGADLSPQTGRARFLSLWSIFSQVAGIGGPVAISGVLALYSLPLVYTLLGLISLGGAAWAILTQPITRLPTGKSRARQAIH